MTARENAVDLRQHALRAATIMVFVLGAGTLGYHLIEGWPVFDALYMTVITLSTIGYGETHTLSTAGRVFTIAIILFGVGNLAYAFAATTQFFAAGGLLAYRRRIRMQRTLAHLTGHTIICGCGRLGSAIAHELRERGVPFVLVERDPAIVERLSEDGETLHVQGDAAEDDVLIAAGVQRAASLVAALNDDASNVFLTLSARVLNPKLVIYGKADDPGTLVKLERAGADHTFSPSLVAGHRIAHQIVRPTITELVGIAAGRNAVELAIEELRVGQLGLRAGTRLSESPFWGRPGLLVLAIKTHEGSVVFPPRADHALHLDDRLVVMGSPARLAELVVQG